MPRRIALAATAPVVIAAGLALSTLDSAVAAFAADALYAVLVFLLVAFLAPRARVLPVAAIALVFCAAIELFQLTPVPARVDALIPGAELVLGSTFQATDLLAYALGVLLAAATDTLVRRRAAGSSRDAPTTPSAGAPAPRPPAGTRSR